MQNNSRWFLALFAAALPGFAFADSTSDALTRIEAETLVLKAREKQLEVQSNIIARQNEIAMKQNTSNMLIQTPVAGDPVVRAMEGIGKAMYATLQLSNGSLVDVAAGDTLPNGMRIISIRSNEVVVQTTTGKHARLAASVPASAVFNSSYPNPGLVLPMPLGLPRGPVK